MMVVGMKVGKAQTTIVDLNYQLRDIFIKLKRAPANTPFLYDMATHIISDNYYTSYNDSTVIAEGMFYTMYEELRYSAYDTTILKPVDSVVNKLNDRKKEDTIIMSILNADFAVFSDDAFNIEGQYFYTTDSTITDVKNRRKEPYDIRNVFLTTINTQVSYFRKVDFVLDTSNIFASNKLLSDFSISDLNPNFARWKVDFGDGAGWREFNPLQKNHYSILYKDTGTYFIRTGIFYYDPYPICNQHVSKLSKTAIQILSNKIPQNPVITYNFSDITVGLYSGCGEVVKGVYIPVKPLIIIEGIDLPNNHSIEDIYEDYVISGDKRLSEIAGTGYDYYIVNFKDTRLDIRQNAKSVIEFLNYLKSIMTNDEQFVVIGESMGGVVARYVLTYMETDTYKNDPSVPKPNQLHNTRLLITNDSPHQGAYVPIAYQMMYKNLVNSTVVKVLKAAKNLFPVLDDFDQMTKILNSPSVKQLLSYHVNSNGPHPDREIFMNELINMNISTNGYPKYCKLMGMTDGLLTGQHQLKTNRSILQAGEKIFNFNLKVKAIILRVVKIDLFEYNLDLFAADKLNKTKKLLEAKDKFVVIKIKGCLRKLLRLNLVDFTNCAINSLNGTPLNVANNVTENYETLPGGIFPTFTLIKNDLDFHDLNLLLWTGKFNVDKQEGKINMVFTYSDWRPGYWVLTPEIEVNLYMPYLDFVFIPVYSGLDIDYNKTNSIKADQNLLDQDVQNYLLANTPFHVVAGLENINKDYPNNLNEKGINSNWSHGYFTNKVIDNVNSHGYLSREIGDNILYLNNLDLGERNADFIFKNIFTGINNPHYSYHTITPLNVFGVANGVYSKLLPFHTKEPGIVSITYQDSYTNGDNKIIEGVLNINSSEIVDCKIPKGNKSIDTLNSATIILNDIVIYPNPFQNDLIIKNLMPSKVYCISFSNSTGQIVYTKSISTEYNSYSLDLSNLSSNLYFVCIRSLNEHPYYFKIQKL